ncbi:MAG: DUF3786 domain-containing protein [Bacillota bacterium]
MAEDLFFENFWAILVLVALIIITILAKVFIHQETKIEELEERFKYLNLNVNQNREAWKIKGVLSFKRKYLYENLQGERLTVGSNYQIAFDKAIADLQMMDPIKVCTNAVAEYSATLGQYTVPFFDRPFIADIKKGEVFDRSTGRRCAPGTGVLILHYLTYAPNIEPSGQWITLKEVPNGGMIFYPAFEKELLDALVNTFQNDIAAFDRAAASLNGKKLNMGDSAAVFAAFPKIPLAVLIWQADEEFAGSANFLFDSTIGYFAPVETIIGFGYYLGHKLICSPFAPESDRRNDPFWDAE